MYIYIYTYTKTTDKTTIYVIGLLTSRLDQRSTWPQSSVALAVLAKEVPQTGLLLGFLPKLLILIFPGTGSGSGTGSLHGFLRHLGLSKCERNLGISNGTVKRVVAMDLTCH